MIKIMYNFFRCSLISIGFEKKGRGAICKKKIVVEEDAKEWSSQADKK